MLDLNQRQFLNVLSSDWDFSLHDAEQFSTELIEVMINNKGIGLAANQVGLDLRSFAIGSGDMDYFKIPGTVRASFAFYNTKSEIDSLVSAIKKAQLMLS